MKVEKREFNSLKDALDYILNDMKKDYIIEEQAEMLDIDDIVSIIAEKKNWDKEYTDKWLGSIADLYPMAAFSIVLREIAVILDQKYDDHISNCDWLYTISTLTGRITKVYKHEIKSYKNFAAFRTIEDAKIACRILRKPLKEMFSE